MKKNCIKCNECFDTRSKQQIYCSKCRDLLRCCVDNCNNKLACVNKLLCGKHYAQYLRKDNVCILVCKGCDEEFINTSNSGRLYYCPDCKNNICKRCNERYIENFENKLCKRCSQYQRRDAAKITYNKICEECGEPFLTNYSKQVFCSKKCKARRDTYLGNEREKERKRRINPPVFLTCVICKIEFLPDILNHKQKCCSSECRDIHNKKMSRKHYHEVVKPREGHLNRGRSFPQHFIFITVKEYFVNLDWYYDNRQTIKNPETNRYLELDIWCPKIRLAIEFDGDQHFIPKFGEKMLHYTKKMDAIKNRLCAKHNIKLIRFNNKDNWKDKDYIINQIEEILNGDHQNC